MAGVSVRASEAEDGAHAEHSPRPALKCHIAQLWVPGMQMLSAVRRNHPIDKRLDALQVDGERLGVGKHEAC